MRENVAKWGNYAEMMRPFLKAEGLRKISTQRIKKLLKNRVAFIGYLKKANSHTFHLEITRIEIFFIIKL